MIRTDLALEAAALSGEAELPGISVCRVQKHGLELTTVTVQNEEGARAIGKPPGRYITLETDPIGETALTGTAEAALLGESLSSLLPSEGTLLVACLGNAAITPDALGPRAARWVLATRHVAGREQLFRRFRPVAVLRTGVLGTTGVESAEAVRGLVDRLHPSAVIAVDALASRRVGRVCCTVQFSDTGIIPGSGVGNHRSALNRETLGVPVLAVGVPTVVDAATLAADLLEESGLPEPDMETLRSRPENLMVTPRDIDQQVRDLGKVIGYGINWALQDLEIEEINALLS